MADANYVGAATRGEAIVKSAMQWVGTPYATGGASKAGVDCSHLVWCVYRDIGLNYDYRNTATFPTVGKFAVTAKPENGDVVLFMGHMGIYTGGKIVSAQSGSGRVQVGEIKWFGGVIAYYRWNG